MLVGDVVGEFELVERDDFLHPLFAGAGGVGVDVHPLRHFRVRFAGHHPPTDIPGRLYAVFTLLHIYSIYK